MERWRDGSEVEFSAHVDEQIPGAHEANLQISELRPAIRAARLARNGYKRRSERREDIYFCIL